jgi:hypothetical protein
MKQALALALSMALAGSMFAAEPPQDSSTPAAKSTRKAATKAPSVANQLNELKEAIEAQQKQIQDLGQQIQNRDAQIQQLQQRLDASQTATNQAQAKADAAAAQTAQQGQTVSAIQTDITDMKANATANAQSLQETQKNLRDQLESPLAIHYKGITITPGGFLAAESVYRNRALGSDINTPFNSVNMAGAAANNVSEFYGSGRQSRITMLAEGKAGDYKMGGYYEADFLAAAVTSNNNESNSYVLRQRQVWGQFASPTWTFTGGQMWSLATETKKGLDNRTEAVPMTIDPQYTVGFSWDRQYGVRLVKNFNNHFWLGASVENPQTTFSARNEASNFALGSVGNASGLYNSAISTCSTSLNSSGSPVTTCTNIANYSFNAMPDFIFKAAAEPGFGHFEVFGILSRYRDRVYPCEDLPTTGTPNCGTKPSVLGAYNDSQTSGGFGANGRITIAKKLDIGAHFLTGQGVGRYGTGGLSDATVNPTGTLGLLRSYQGLGTVELHLKKMDWYMYGGEEYAGKRWSVDPNTGKDVGYGPPSVATAGCYTESLPSSSATTGFNFAGGCSVDTQRLIEGTVGFWIRLMQGPHGRLQFGPQYSYVVRDAWWGTYIAATSTTPAVYSSPHGIDNMFFTSFRYYLP